MVYLLNDTVTVGELINAQQVLAMFYTWLWWPFRNKLGYECPYCRGPLPATSRLAAEQHIAVCPGDDDSARLAKIVDILPPETANAIMDDLGHDNGGYSALLDYVQFVNDGERATDG